MGKGAQREGGKSQFDEKMEERFAKIIEVSFLIFPTPAPEVKFVDAVTAGGSVKFLPFI